MIVVSIAIGASIELCELFAVNLHLNLPSSELEKRRGMTEARAFYNEIMKSPNHVTAYGTTDN